MRQRVLHLGVCVFICVVLIIGFGWQTSMAINKNDVQLVRVYTREKEGRILKETFPSDAEFEVVVEAEAGETIHSLKAEYFIQIVVRDLTNFTIVHKDSLKGNLKDEPWNEPVLLHAFPIRAQGAAKENHIYEVLASLCVGKGEGTPVSFAKSPMFIIYTPEEDTSREPQ